MFFQVYTTVPAAKAAYKGQLKAVTDLSTVPLSLEQQDNLYRAFSFAKDIHHFISLQGYNDPIVVIQDHNNFFAKIHAHSETLEECLTSGTRGYKVGDKL